MSAQDLEHAAALLWARFRQAVQARDPALEAAATRALVRFLAHPHLPPRLRGLPDAGMLAEVAASMRRVLAWIVSEGDARAEAEARHELAVFLWENQQRLPGDPVREGIASALKVLRLHRRGGRADFAARSHHVVGLLAKQMAYGGRIRDQERAIRHLARAALAFEHSRPDLAAEALFSSIGAWGRRRIGDPVENHAQAAACWQQARARFARASETRRELAANIEFAKALFTRRYNRVAARDELIDLLGFTFERIAALPDVPAGSPACEQERQMQVEALSLLGETHRTRRARTRFAPQATECFEAVDGLLEPDDHPDRAAPHRLRRAVFMFEEAVAGRASMADARAATMLARATAEASSDMATRLAASYWDGVVLAEMGEAERALARFEAVAAGRNAHVAGTANPFGIEERAEVASGLAAAGSLAALQVHGPLAAVNFFEQARIGLSGQPVAPIQLEEDDLATACPEGGALVWLLMHHRRSALVVASRDGACLRFTTLERAILDDQRLRGAIEKWLAALTKAGSQPSDVAVPVLRETLDPLLKHLGRCLTRPLGRMLRTLGLVEGAEIVMVAGGEAALLPIHAAPIDNRAVFIDRYRLRLAPSVSCLVGEHATVWSEGGGKRPLILSDPDRLGIAGIGEADRVAAHMLQAGLLMPRIVERFSTPQQVLAAFEEAPIVHVTAHSAFLHADPLHSAIVIGDRQFSAHAVLNRYDLRNCRLAFLASCESALADAGTGADLLTGLASAFLEKGAASVIGTLWPTADVPAAMIVDGFYRRLLSMRQPPAQALREAMIETRARFPHPLDWAPFVICGR